MESIIIEITKKTIQISENWTMTIYKEGRKKIAEGTKHKNNPDKDIVSFQGCGRYVRSEFHDDFVIKNHLAMLEAFNFNKRTFIVKMIDKNQRKEVNNA